MAHSQYGLDVENADALRLPFHASFDVIFAPDVIEHNSNLPECVKQLLEVFRFVDIWLVNFRIFICRWVEYQAGLF